MVRDADTENAESVTNAGTAIVNIIHSASVCARCCSQAPFLMKKAGMVQDRCLLYVFRCAVYFAETPKPQPKKLLWWNWKD